MKKSIFAMAIAVCAIAHAQPIPFSNGQVTGNLAPHELGSGNLTNVPTARPPVFGTNTFHSPQYMPYHPTAATIYPRVVEVDCLKVVGRENECGYQWEPSMGRAEYLFVQPRVKEVPPVTIEKIVEVPGPERVILKEVPPKKVRQ